MGEPTKKIKYAGDKTTGRVQKFQTIHENNDNTPIVVYNNSSESKNRRTLAQPGIDFVTSYYNSPGFIERLKKHNDSLDDKPYAFAPSDKLAIDYINYGIGKDTDDPSYDPNSKTINTGSTNTTYGGFTYGMPFIVSHEGGHAIDYSMKKVDRDHGSEYDKLYNHYLDYSGSYPIFQNNKKFRSIKNELTNKLINRGLSKEEAIKQSDKYGNKLIKSNADNIEHDARARESYADYIGFLQMLNEDGIHDARKSNIDGSNTFTKEKLDKFKEKHKDWQNMRFFQNFDEEDIIRMPNEVASNYLIKKRSLENQGHYLT